MLESAPPGTYINKAIVTSPEEPTPGCTVSLHVIDCGNNPPENYDQEPTPVTRNPSITIIKDAQPNTSHPFQFTVTGGGQTGFALVDDGTNTARMLTNIVAGQTYTITEIQPTDGSYALSGISCTGGGTGSTVIATGQATVTVAAARSVVCTFVNGAITPARHEQTHGLGTGSGRWPSPVRASGGSSSSACCSRSPAWRCSMLEMRRRRREERLAAARLRVD